MGLFSRNKQRGDAASCEHPKLDPRWDRIEDAGQGDRVDHYVCRGCGASFSHEQAAGLDVDWTSQPSRTPRSSAGTSA